MEIHGFVDFFLFLDMEKNSGDSSRKSEVPKSTRNEG